MMIYKSLKHRLERCRDLYIWQKLGSFLKCKQVFLQHAISGTLKVFDLTFQWNPLKLWKGKTIFKKFHIFIFCYKANDLLLAKNKLKVKQVCVHYTIAVFHDHLTLWNHKFSWQDLCFISFPTNYNFLISISFQAGVIDFSYFKPWLLLDKKVYKGIEFLSQTYISNPYIFAT